MPVEVYAEAVMHVHKTIFQFQKKKKVNLSVICTQHDFSLMDFLYSPDPDGDTNRIHTSSVGLSFPY